MAAATPWPRLYRLDNPHEKTAFSHELFLGPGGQCPEIFYSNAFDESEQLARRFLDESIVGFDLEWIYPARPNPTLKEAVSLIQVASEDTIAFFHIGQQDGGTSAELLPPSLRSLIENSAVRKSGQSIMGDFWRLKTHFGLTPKGAFELSHMHKLVAQEDAKYNTMYVKGGLQRLVWLHFGLNLIKDLRLHQDWLKPFTPAHRAYAAADVYASLMLFHRMNAKRLAMLPCPPLPRSTEEYVECVRGLPKWSLIELEPLRPGAEILDARVFFWLHEGLQEDHGLASKLTPEAQRLYEKLAVHRERAAENMGLAPRHVATDSVLRIVAQERPRSLQECLKLKGLGLEKHRRIFGRRWVGIVKQFMDRDRDEIREAEDATKTVQEPDEPQHVVPAKHEDPPSVQTPLVTLLSLANPVVTREGASLTLPSPRSDLIPPLHTSLSFSIAETDSTNSAEIRSLPDIPVLHTGLSFSMADTNFDDAGIEKQASHQKRERQSSRQKRKRSSSLENDVHHSGDK